MNIDLAGKTALVTGSSKGIGLAIAEGLARAGAAVVVNGRKADELDVIAERLGRGARGVAADLATAEGCASLVESVPEADIVVSNMGVFRPADFFETSDEEWERHWQANVMAGVRLARAYLPRMRAKNWGRFVMISSESAFNIPVEMIHYGVTKTADVALARGLAKRMAGTGVTVNAVLPGPTMSDGVETMLADEIKKTGKSAETVMTDFIKANRPSSIQRRPTSTEEVANMIIYVCSQQASGTTGAALRVEGGVIDSL